MQSIPTVIYGGIDGCARIAVEWDPRRWLEVCIGGAPVRTANQNNRRAHGNLPLGGLPERLTENNAPEDQLIIPGCRTDRRYAKAAALLREAGFPDVRMMRGGMVVWNRSVPLVVKEPAFPGREESLMKTLFILNGPPYGSERCKYALRLAHAPLRNDP